MATYIEYKLDDKTTILIESDEAENSGSTKVGVTDRMGNVIRDAGQTFGEAFTNVKNSASVIRQQLEDLRADEVEVVFGLKATGEAGNFAVGKVGLEANYTVKLKWMNEKISGQ